MEPPEGWDPYGRPARRTQWLVSALAYHYGLDRGVENEIVVLATGLDQYLQEVFHHLDCAGAGRIPGEDFRTLCRVLGLEEAAAAEADPEECAGLWDGLSAELTFRQFHARLCGYFSTKAGSAPRRAVPRLPLGRESEHIETQIRLRSPRRRRRRSLPRRSATLGAALQQSAKRSRAGSRPSSRQAPRPLLGGERCRTAGLPSPAGARAGTPPLGTETTPTLNAASAAARPEEDQEDPGRGRGRQRRRDGEQAAASALAGGVSPPRSRIKALVFPSEPPPPFASRRPLSCRYAGGVEPRAQQAPPGLPWPLALLDHCAGPSPPPRLVLPERRQDRTLLPSAEPNDSCSC